MEVIQISHNFRPLRIGYAVQFHDKQQLLDAAERATIAAGGMYNPILPAGIDDSLLQQLADTFKIDVVENLTGRDLSFQNNRPHLAWPKFHSNSTYDNDRSGATVKVMDVGHKMQAIYHKGRRDPDTNNCALPTWGVDNPYALSLAFQFGKYPDLKKLNYNNAFIHFLETKSVEIKQIDDVQPELYERYTPIHLTAEGLALRSNLFVEHSGNGFYVGDRSDPIDLVNFWNLRAAGHDIIFVCLDKHSKGIIKYLASEAVSKRDYHGKYYASIWFRIEQGEDSVKEFISELVSPPVLCPITSGYWTGGYAERAVEPYFKNQRHIIAQLESTERLPRLVFQKPKPPIFRSEQYQLPQKIVLSMEPLGLYRKNNRYMLDVPPVDELTDWVSNKMTYRTASLRLKKERIDLITDTRESVERLSLIHYDEFFEKLFMSRGLEIKKDTPGTLADKLADHMGGIDSCRIFKVKGVREMLHEMKVEDSIPWSSAIQRIRDVDDDGRSTFEDYKNLYIQARTTGNLTPEQCMDFLVKNSLMRPGYNLKCENCRLDFWISLERSKDYIECPYCYKSVHMAVQIRTRGDIMYRRSGLFGKDNNLEGGVSVILTLMHLTKLGFKFEGSPFCTARKIKSGDTEIECETDFIVVGNVEETNVELIIGESKTKLPITRNDAENLQKVKRQLDGDGLKTYICFTKLAPFTEGEIALFKEMDANGVCPILFNEKEVADYNLYFNYDDSELAVKSSSNCKDLVNNSRKIYLE